MDEALDWLLLLLLLALLLMMAAYGTYITDAMLPRPWLRDGWV